MLYVAIDVLLKFLRPHYSLIYNAESDYGRGPYFWIMDLNFLLRCALSLGVVGALSAQMDSAGRARNRQGLGLLVAWAVCSGLLAFFADDIEGQHVHGTGIVHLVLAFIAFTCVAIGTLVVSISLRAGLASRSLGWSLLVLSVLGLIAYLLLGAAAKQHPSPDGLYERIFLGLELSWFGLAAWICVRSPAAPHLVGPTDRKAPGMSAG